MTHSSGTSCPICIRLTNLLDILFLKEYALLPNNGALFNIQPLGHGLNGNNLYLKIAFAK